jgi:hypothetical protein
MKRYEDLLLSIMREDGHRNVARRMFACQHPKSSSKLRKLDTVSAARKKVSTLSQRHRTTGWDAELPSN